MGAKVAIFDIQEDKLKEAVAALEGKGISAMYAVLNVTEAAGWKAAVDSVVAAWGRIDALVQAAGITGRTGECWARCVRRFTARRPLQTAFSCSCWCRSRNTPLAVH